MEACHDAILNQSETSAPDETYNIWRRKNPTKRPYLDANKLANTTRAIVQNKLPRNAELDGIKTNIIQTNTSPTLEKNKTQDCKSTPKKSVGQSTSKNNFIRNNPHTKEGFVLKAKFISPVLP